jgi:hypothetical protein
MPGQHIWHIKIRKLGGAEHKFAGTQHHPREPRDREVIELEIGGKLVRAKIVTIHGSYSGSTGTFEINADEIKDDRTTLGFREADEDDFDARSRSKLFGLPK